MLRTIFVWSFIKFKAYMDFIWIILYLFYIQNGRHSKMAEISKILNILESSTYDAWFLCKVSVQSVHNLPRKRPDNLKWKQKEQEEHEQEKNNKKRYKNNKFPALRGWDLIKNGAKQ